MKLNLMQKEFLIRDCDDVWECDVDKEWKIVKNKDYYFPYSLFIGETEVDALAPSYYRRIKKIKGISHGTYEVWLRGSKSNIRRVIWSSSDWANKDKFFINWYGRYVEVERGAWGTWHTVESY